ncbi:MAG: hypothetical protein JAZ11_00290 [Candidatus Thiodiazotropha lotti]|nr:hypothetical protein [Candidatus Thiodiazotropha lotti]
MSRPADTLTPLRLKGACDESHTGLSRLHDLVKQMARRAAQTDLEREGAKGSALPSNQDKR